MPRRDRLRWRESRTRKPWDAGYADGLASRPHDTDLLHQADRVAYSTAGTGLAATMIGGGRWVAGQTLMREADAGTWARMVQLYQACSRTSATELCEAAMAAPTIPAAP